ncbi:uncharacterized protein PFLUO_LOCUS3737 [Penicillium psychrofluorescens]|uniref:uncharacterized protein n=1 Tax=Penicillium psychrofluorescens TaxID=3158075 RepID=UPI003CCE3B9C
MILSVYPSAPAFEHHPDGLGVQHAQPRISWRFSSNGGGSGEWIQQAYELKISRNESIETHYFESEQSVLVPWPSSPLASREKAEVRVRCFGASPSQTTGPNIIDTPTEWSRWATVEAALLDKGDWKAQMITGSMVPQPDRPVRPLRFRKVFELTEHRNPVTSARIYVTSYGVYRAFINGESVGDHVMAPGWTSYHHRLHYQVFDVTSQLQTHRRNVIEAEVGPGWFASRLAWGEGRRCIYGDHLGVLLQLEIRFEDSAEQLVVGSDSTWTWKHSPLLSSEIYDGEIYDMTLEQAGWHRADHDVLLGWKNANSLPFPKAQLSVPDSPPVRVIETMPARRIFTSPSGKVLVDFGQNLTGKIAVRSLKKTAGHRVTFRYAEVLENGELGIRPLRSAKATDAIICSEETLNSWSPSYTFHGFRYVEIEGWTPEDTESPLKQENITALVTHTDMNRTGWFSCSEPLVNRLHENAIWSMRGNFLSIPTDCPQRDERMGWTGDIQIFSPSANFLYNTSGILFGWLQDLASEQALAGGVPPLVVPNILKDEWPPYAPHAVWADAAVLVPWNLYSSYGDPGILRHQYPSMQMWLDQGIRRDASGLWDPSLWQLGDWLDPAAPAHNPGESNTDSDFVANAYLVHITSVMSKAAAIVGRQDDAKRYTEDWQRLRGTFQKRYITPDGLVVGDTQTSLALALVFNLLETPEQKRSAGERLARRVRLAKFRVATGFAGTPVITHALTLTGHTQLAFRMLLERKCPSWLYPVTMGATTMWERWDSMLPDGSIHPGQMTSFNHYALGSIVNWLHECVGGIRALEPGWKTFFIRPHPGGALDWAETRYESPYGTIKSYWIIKSDGDKKMFHLTITVPPNSMAWVLTPEKQGLKDTDVKESGLRCFSGDHEFSCEYTGQNDWPPKRLRIGYGPENLDDDDDNYL